MRLAGHTFSFRHEPFPDALDQLVALGFDHVEVWLGHVGDVEEVQRVLAERRVGVVAVGGGGYYEHGDDPGWAFEVARRLEAPIVVACVAPQLARLVAAHADERVGLCVENHWDQPLATAADVQEVLSLDPMLSACLDTGHALLAGVAPDAFARALGPRLRHVHLKEARRPTLLERSLGKRVRRRFLPRPGPVRPGNGRLEISLLLRALEEIGYRGYVSVEYEGEEAASAVLELSRAWRSAGAR